MSLEFVLYQTLFFIHDIKHRNLKPLKPSNTFSLISDSLNINSAVNSERMPGEYAIYTTGASFKAG